MALPRSPLAPDPQTPLPVKGVRIATAATGTRYKGRDDVMLAICDEGTAIAGVFTRSATRSAPVIDCEEKIGGTATGPAAFFVNAGNANAFTGRHGEETVTTLTQSVAERFGLDVARVFTASTGVIGVPLAADGLIAALDGLAAQLGGDGFERAALAIGTTDTYPKLAARQIEIDGHCVTITGIAKGSGMIAPDMATMLGFVFTDAAIAPPRLQVMLRELTATSFNAISVDSDTSTSDTVLVAATGASGVAVDDNAQFAAALRDVLHDLAQQIIRDGEGATKLMQVTVTGAQSDADAKGVAMAVVNSPLVKTALAGGDPNWGRIIAAIGKAGVVADRDLIRITFGGDLVAEKGWVADSYREEIGQAAFAKAEVEIGIDLGLGQGRFTAWGCDLTDGYIRINADYRS